MAFAQPLAFLFSLLFIPIILLYLLKQRRRRVQVSTLLFWDQILRDERTVTSLTKLRKLLSLLLQLLFVALLVFALSRPLLAKDMLGARRIVLFVDTSASMLVEEEDGRRFDLAQKLARDVALGVSLGDTLMLVSVASEADIVLPFTNSRKDLRDAVDALEPTHGESNFHAAFALLEHLPVDERETYVYVVSDGAFEPVEMEVREGFRFAYLKVGVEAENVGITAFQVRPYPASPRDFEILFEASNETGEERRVPFELRVGGGLVDAGELLIPPHGRAIHAARQFSAAGGEVEVYLDFEDAFPLDNRAYGVLPEPAPIPVLLVTAGNLFLETALATDDGLALETVSPMLYRSGSLPLLYPLEKYVKIFDGWAPLSPPEGHGIYIGAWPAVFGRRGDELRHPIITDWDRAHPINRHLHLTNVSIETAYAFEIPRGFSPLIRSFNDPLVLLRDDEQGHTLIVTFDMTASDLPLRVAFPILMANTLRYMAGGEAHEAWRSVPLGSVLSAEEVDFYAARNHPHTHEGETSEWVLKPGETVGPDDLEEADTPKERGLLSVDRAGVYRLATSTGEVIPLFAGNLNSRRESRIAPSEELPLKSSAPAPEITEGFRLGIEPWFFLIVLALLLVMAEWVLFHRRLVE